MKIVAVVQARLGSTRLLTQCEARYFGWQIWCDIG